MFRRKIIFISIILLAAFLVSFSFVSAKSLVPDKIANANISAGEISVEPDNLAPVPAEEPCPIGGCGEEGIKLTRLLKDKKISLSLIVLAGLIDGINPCAIGMLILLLGYLMVFAKQPEKMFLTGTIYIAVIFITYFLLGYLFSNIVYQLLAWPYYARVSEIIKYVIVGLIVLAGLINVKDFFWYGKGLTLGVSQSKVPILMRYIQKASLPATIILGVLVTLFELPCSLPLYVGAIAMMATLYSVWATLGYLLVYNLMFILPLAAVFVIILTTKKIAIAKDWQERGNKWMKLSMGLAQILIGVGLLLI